VILPALCVLDAVMTRYAPIGQFLEAQEASRVRLRFADVEKILGSSLPKSADAYQAWWANDPGHSQAKAWMEAGWQTANLNLSGRTIEFVRARKSSSMRPPADPWGALAGTVTIYDAVSLTEPTGEIWDAEG